MADIAFIAVVVVFFVICISYVRGLDRIVRSAEETEVPAGPEPGSNG